MPLRPCLVLPALLLLGACGTPLPARSIGSTPIGTDASTGQPSLSRQGAGPGGINRNYYIGGDPNFPETRGSGRGAR